MANSTVVINTVARRLRDNANLAYPRAVLLRFVDHAQRVLNAHTKNQLARTDPAASAFHTFSCVYRIATLIGPNVSSIEIVREYVGGANAANAHGKQIERIPFHTLTHQDPRWFQRTGPELVAWATIGKDLLVLYPILTRPIATGDISIVYTSGLPSIPLDNNTNDLVLSDDLIPVLQDLVEVLGCFKGRRFSEASDPLARISQHLNQIGSTYVATDVEGR